MIITTVVITMVRSRTRKISAIYGGSNTHDINPTNIQTINTMAVTRTTIAANNNVNTNNNNNSNSLSNSNNIST